MQARVRGATEAPTSSFLPKGGQATHPSITLQPAAAWGSRGSEGGALGLPVTPASPSVSQPPGGPVSEAPSRNASWGAAWGPWARPGGGRTAGRCVLCDTCPSARKRGLPLASTRQRRPPGTPHNHGRAARKMSVGDSAPGNRRSASEAAASPGGLPPGRRCRLGGMRVARAAV